MAAWVTPSSLAALVKLASRAAASNEVRAVSGGSFRLSATVGCPCFRHMVLALHKVMATLIIYAVELLLSSKQSHATDQIR
jgi:hypothetical protein